MKLAAAIALALTLVGAGNGGEATRGETRTGGEQATTAVDGDASSSLSANEVEQAVLAPSEATTGSARPLGFEEVLAGLAATHPDYAIAERDVDRARAQEMAARGHWDPKLGVQARYIPVGYYERLVVDASVTQSTPLYGLTVSAGYRGGWGNFPIYKGEYQTLSAGELRAAVELPLWRDGRIDAGRAGIRKQRELVGAAECGRDATGLSLYREAATKYWSWVAAGHTLRIQEELLETARKRDSGLRGQAELGSIPDIVVVDNERLVLDRESKQIEAGRKFSTASLDLSLVFRNADLETVRVGPERLPVQMPSPGAVDFGDESADLERAMQLRPEFCALQKKRAAAQVELDLAKNRVGPDLRAGAFVSQDVGAGPPELRPVEFGAGVNLSIPLALRKARGEARAARAKLAAIDAELRALRDGVLADVRRARVNLDAAARQVAVAERQARIAERLAEAEAIKFEQGASDLVVVNLRELQAAEAARSVVAAQLDYLVARADYAAAIGDFELPSP